MNLVWRYRTWKRNRFWDKAWEYRKAIDDHAAWHQIMHGVRMSRQKTEWGRRIYSHLYGE